MIERHDQWLEVEFANQAVERIGAVFAPAEWDDAIIVILATIHGKQLSEFLSLHVPVDFGLFVFDLPAHIAHALVVEDDRFLRFGQQAPGTEPQVIQHSYSFRHDGPFVD
jgi:hypothetical protein